MLWILIGATLGTRAPDIYRALIESTAFGTRVIIEAFEKRGIPVTELVAALFAGSVSATSERVTTAALALTAAAFVATALNVNVCDSPAAIAPRPQKEAPPLPALQPSGNATRVNPDPSVKLTLPPVDADGPRFVTVTM